MTIKVSDEVRYTGQSMHDLTHGKIYEVVGLGGWGFDVLDDVNESSYIASNRCELVREETK